MPTVKEAIAHLKEMPLDRVIAYDIWMTDDIESLLEESGEEIELSQDEMNEILRRFHSNFDATVGLNWDTLQIYIDWFVSERRKKDAEV